MLFDQRAPLHQRLAHDVAALQRQHVEDEEVERCACGAIVLQHIERRPALGIERNDFAVDHSVIRHRIQRLHDAGIAAIEVVIVPGAKLQFAAGFDGEGAISIKL